jgi:hypothetical protein
MKTDCLTTDKIQQYLDRCLSPEEKARVEKHLGSCSLCRKELKTIQTVFKHADVFAKKIVNSPAPSDRVDSLMKKINLHSSSIDWSSFLTTLIRWSLFPALAIAFLFYSFSGSVNHHKDLKSDKTNQFNLADNSLHPIIESDSGELIIEKTAVKASTQKSLPTQKVIKLKKSSVIMVKVAKSKFIFSDQAEFVIKNKTITLHKGRASFKLKGPHRGFTVVTNHAQFTPMGTSFELWVTSAGSRLLVRSGSVKAKIKSGYSRLLQKNNNIFINPDGKFLSDIPASSSKPVVNETHPNASAPVLNDNNDQAETLLDTF